MVCTVSAKEIHRTIFYYKLFYVYSKYKRLIANLVYIQSTPLIIEPLFLLYKNYTLLKLIILETLPSLNWFFSDLYDQFLQDRIPFFTDASKTDSDIYVEFVIYSPSLNI